MKGVQLAVLGLSLLAGAAQAADPVFPGLPASLTISEDTPSQLNLAGNTFSDDSVEVEVTVAMTLTGVGTPAGTFALAAGGGLALSGNVQPTFTVKGDPAAVANYLNTPTNFLYTPPSNLNGSNALTLTVSAEDFDSFNGTLGTVAINIDPEPTVTGSLIPLDGTYGNGAHLDFTVNFSENVTVNTAGGTPYLALTLDTGGSVQAAYVSGSGTTSLSFRYTVATGNADSNGIAIASAITRNGGTIRSSSTNIDAVTSGIPFCSTTDVLVDALAPTVSSIVRHSPSATNINAGPAIYRVSFSEAVTGVDLTDFTLTETGTAYGSLASVSGSGSVYDVTVNNISGDGTERVNLKSTGTGITDTSGNAIASGYTSGQVYTVDSTAPVVTSVSVPANATYIASQNLDFIVNFSEGVLVDTTGGTPALALTIGSTSRSANYLSGSGSSTLTFRYTTSAGDLDTNGISVGSLSMNNGSMVDIANNNATLTLNSVASTASVLVDAAAPTIAGRTVPNSATYGSGQQLEFTVTWSENVTVNTGGGTPYLAVTLDTGGAVQAAYSGGTGTTTLTFRYTVASGNADTNGITVGSAITVNGGTIRDGSGNDAAVTSLGFGSTAAVLVDGIAPSIASINRQTPSTATTNASSVVYRATFSESVTGVGSSDFTLTATGSASGNLASISAVSASVYDITVDTISGAGTLRLDLNNAGTGIVDDLNNTIAAGYSAGQVYTIDAGAPTLPAANIVVNNQSDPHKVIITFSEALDSTTLGAANAWTLTANGGTPVYSIASVGLSGGNIVTLTLAAVDIGNDATRITNIAANAHLKITPPATLTDLAGNAYAAGLVTEAGATHLLDTTAPTLSAVSATAADAISGTLNATASEKVRAYWIAVAPGATAPNLAQVEAAVDYGAVAIIASGNGALPAAAASLALSNVLPVADYDLHVVAEDAAGNSSASISTTSWQPLLAAPSATTGSASVINQTAATLNGAVNDNGKVTTVSFDYGQTTAYGANAAATTGSTIAAGAGNSAASVALTNLSCGTSYHFRVRATNSLGTALGNDAIFNTSACEAVSTNPFNAGGTQARANIEATPGFVPAIASSDIITNLDKFGGRVGISDNGVVVVLNTGISEAVKFRDNPPDNVLISLPSQKPLDLQINGNVLTIEIDPETPNPPQPTILGTSTLQLSGSAQAKGLQLLQGEAFIGNTQSAALIGGMELSKHATLRSVVVQSGVAGGIAGFRKLADGSGSISAESGEVRITVRMKSSAMATLKAAQSLSLPGTIAATAQASTDQLSITLQAGEVARFNSQGELEAVFLGSLSGRGGKTGDALSLASPDKVTAFPATTLLFDGGDIPARLGMPLSDFMNMQFDGLLHFSQSTDGLMDVVSPTGSKFHARTVIGFEVVPGAPDMSSINIDGSLSLTAGGIRSTWQPMLEGVEDFADYLASSRSMTTSVRADGLVQASAGNSFFYLLRPRFDLLSSDGTTQGLTANGAALFYTNALGKRQQLDAAFHDIAQLQAAAALQGWTFSRAGYELFVQSPGATRYRVIPDAKVEILQPDTTPRGIFRNEGQRLYFYYQDAALRQGFSLQAE